ncbi:MAG: DnaD domain protein [Erysipelotrichaceae bacterium]|nr:DnaD domain protein [Erysipelotrichaceae bacterium]
MRFETDYRYQIATAENSDALTSIAVLYMPLIGSEAAALYALMYTEGTHNHEICTIDRLLKLSTLNIDELQKATETLERHGLLSTGQRKSDGLIRFELLPIKDAGAFFDSDIFSRAYISRVGQQQYDLTQTHYLISDEGDDEFEDRSASLAIAGLEDWSDNMEEQYQKYSRLHRQFSEGKLKVDFDTDELLSLKQMNLYWSESMRTEKNITAVAEIASYYGLKPEEVVDALGDASDFTNKTVDFNKFMNSCLKISSKKKAENLTADYSLPPSQFLQAKRPDVPVVEANHRLLDDLVMKMNMEPEVVNVLIEYVLDTRKTLSRNYVEAIAANWLRLGIDTKDKALEEVKNSQSKRRKNTSAPDFTAAEMQTEEVDIEELRKKMFAGKEK